LAEITPPLFVHAMFLPNPAGWSVSMSVHAQSLCSTVGRPFVSSISYLCTLRFLDQHLVLTPFWQYQASFFPFPSYPWVLWLLYLVMQERQRQIRVCARGRALSLWSSVRTLQWNSQWSLTRGWGRVGWNQSPIFCLCPVSAQPCGLVGVNCLRMPSPCAALWVGFLLGYQLSVYIKIPQHLHSFLEVSSYNFIFSLSILPLDTLVVIFSYVLFSISLTIHGWMW